MRLFPLVTHVRLAGSFQCLHGSSGDDLRKVYGELGAVACMNDATVSRPSAR